MTVEAEFENVSYVTLVRKDGKSSELFGTSYKVPAVTGTEEKNEVTFVYYATNESGTTSYGEGNYEDYYIV